MRGNFVKTISVTSGKGGVGKSTLVANLAVELAKKGNRVLLLDGDLGMANLHILFGARPKHSLWDVAKGEKVVSQVIEEVHPRISLLPGGSGIYEFNYMEPIQKQVLLDQVSELESQFDVMLIDTAPGVDSNVVYLNSAAQEIVVVLTPDPSSLADSYALIKVLNQRCRETRFSVVCNMVKDEVEAKALFGRLSDVTSKFLCVSLDYSGFIPADPVLRKAVRSQQLVSQIEPRSPSSFAFRELAQKLSRYEELAPPKGGVQFFWQQLVGLA